MESYRRSFLKMAAISGGAEAMLQLASSCVETEKKNSCPDYQALDKVLQLPVLKKELFPSPIIMEKIELLQDRKNWKHRGVIKVPSVSGMGVTIDPAYISLHKIFGS